MPDFILFYLLYSKMPSILHCKCGRLCGKCLQKVTCKIFQVDIVLDPGNTKGKQRRSDWFCELSHLKPRDKNLHKLLKSPNYRLENIPQSFISENEHILTSGEVWVDITDVWVQPDHSVMVLEQDSKVSWSEENMLVTRQSQVARFSESIGEKKMLLVKIRATGLNLFSLTEEDIFRGVFGKNEGSMNSQYQACSHNQLSFQPVTGPGVSSLGVLTVTIPRTLFGRDLVKIYNLASEETKKEFGGFDDIDHVAYFLGFGTHFGSFFNMGWSGFSFLNGKMSIYNNLSGRYLSPLMHEVAHNIGLHHSTEGNDEYGDETGYMGKNYPRNDDPLMCFNAAHSWQLGWYQDRNVEIFPDNDGLNWSGQLFGVDDYNSTNANAVLYAIVLKIKNVEPLEDYYIMYNAQKGINRQVKEYPNKTMVVGSHGRSTTIRKVLGEQSEFRLSRYNNSNQDIIFRVCEKKIDSVSALVYTLSSLAGEWYDSRGTEFNCDWYDVGERCISHGNGNSNFGMYAMDVCCTCIDEHSER